MHTHIVEMIPRDINTLALLFNEYLDINTIVLCVMNHIYLLIKRTITISLSHSLHYWDLAYCQVIIDMEDRFAELNTKINSTFKKHNKKYL